MPQNHWVFINIPYDEEYEPLYIALISGLVTLGLTPRCTLEIPADTTRLRRIYQLAKRCHYSLHDLSRVKVHLGPIHHTPRFNMPFEAGLAVALSLNGQKHHWRVLESTKHRLQQSLSDLNGHDPYIHYDTPIGILNALSNIFAVSKKPQPSIANMQRIYRALFIFSKTYKDKENLKSLYSAKAFKDMILAAKVISKAAFKKYS